MSLILPRGPRLSRRALLATGSAAAGMLAMPAILRASNGPVFTHGVQSGDASASGGMVWTRVDRPSRILLEVSTTESFADARRVAQLTALPDSDMAVKCLIDGVAPDQRVFYRFTATDLSDVNSTGQPVTGQFRAAPTQKRDIRFGWSGDTAGQGFGIPEEGMRTYAAMSGHELDFFIHSGDTIYADGPIKAEQEHAGGVWKNVVVIPEVEKVAETLDEFRGRYKYNQMDRFVQSFCSEVPFYYQWDDHEVTNNWSPGKDLSGDDRYTEKSIALLSARAGRAFHEMTPISYTAQEPGRVYRAIHQGPLLDIFMLDLRGYRAANNDSMQDSMGGDATLLGEA